MVHPNGQPQPPRKLTCPKCSEQFDSAGELQAHILEKHGG